MDERPDFAKEIFVIKWKRSAKTRNFGGGLKCDYMTEVNIIIYTGYFFFCVTYISFWWLSVPDDLVLQLLQNRLAQLDAVTKGWVIHGFPKTREQAESLTKAGYEPNRYAHSTELTKFCAFCRC